MSASEHRSRPEGALFLVGTGPGDPRQLTGRALDVLASADAVFGYAPYLDLLRPILPGLDYRPSAITQEEARTRAAVELALGGSRVALVGSGDAGVYGLAGLALEILEQLGATTLPVEVVPGVTAALSAAALLGAPLGHDFCAISLSDLLTPWAAIRARLEAAAAAGFVTALYNPKSQRRTAQFAEACEIFLCHRSPQTPVGLVRNAFRDGQQVSLTTLATLAGESVDMLTTVIIGNTATRRWNGKLITPRGYLSPRPAPPEDEPAEPAADPLANGAHETPATVIASGSAGPREVVLLVGHGTRDDAGLAEYRAFAAELARLSGERVVSACLEINDPDVPRAVATAVEEGARAITVVPLLLGAATHQKNDIPTAIAWSRARYPDVAFSYGVPLGAHASIAEALAARAGEALAQEGRGATIAEGETAVLLVGRGSSDPDSNGDLYKVGRLLHEGRGYGWVECCYIAMARPDLAEGIDRCVRLGARRIVLLPHMLFSGVLSRRIAGIATEMAPQYPAVEIVTARTLGAEPRVLEVVLQRIAEARSGEAAANCDACRYRVRMTGFEDDLGLPQGSDHNHGLRGTGPADPANDHAHGAPRSFRPAQQGR